MNTFKEYNDFLISRGYTNPPYAFEYLDGVLTSVTYSKNDKDVVLSLYHDPDIEFTDDLEVCGVFLESTICNQSNFYDGSKEGISLANNASEEDYIHHDLSLFEYCLELQQGDYLGHEIKILKDHIRNIEFIRKVMAPILEKSDFILEYSSVMNINFERESSDLVVSFKHYNGDEIFFDTDSLTGDLRLDGKYIDLGMSETEALEFLKENIFKTGFGMRYLYEGEGNKDTFRTNLSLLEWKEKGRKPGIEILRENVSPEYLDIYDEFCASGT